MAKVLSGKEEMSSGKTLEVCREGRSRDKSSLSQNVNPVQDGAAFCGRERSR